MGSDGVRIPVLSNQCLRQKPLTERPCNLVPCPQWVSGPWSGCSVTCGKGQKIRSVSCQDAKQQHSEDCDMETMPATKIECDSGLICSTHEDTGTYFSGEHLPPFPIAYHRIL
ncbi:hypothetical protein AVEN_74270-1 [Araneus ventricosus]|uniref:Uncharacterized protein n=2 Tax=Araneus ventricosus TaxID=182803 RepID=A0A4Y2WXY8_ARAVE|nr:hypothetical protein AVEN_74270-1 [Araneus ventricosus]